MKNVDYKKIGLNPDKFEATVEGDKKRISYYDIPEVYALNKDFVQRYTEGLTTGKIHSDYFVDPKDGKFAKIFANFMASDWGTPEAEANYMAVCSYMNTVSRVVRGCPFKDEVKYVRKDIASYESGESTAYSPVDYVTKRYVLKEVAWLVTHAFVTGLFQPRRCILQLIPVQNEKIWNKWNDFINDIDDISDEVKKIFIITDGRCVFSDDCKKDSISVSYESSNNVQENTNNIIRDNIPEAEVIESVNVEEAILDEQCDRQIALDDERDAKKEIDFAVSFVPHAEAEYTFAQLLNKAKKEGSEVGIDPIIEQSMTPPATPDDDIVKIAGESVVEELQMTKELLCIPKARETLEDYLPELKKFTSICERNGYSVEYAIDTKEWIGMINATVTKNSATKVVKIDPYLVYGDTIRVCSNISKDHDIRKECFVPISGEEYILKILNGTFTSANKAALNRKIPKAVWDSRKNPMFLDRIDLRGLHADGEMGIPFSDWKKLIENLIFIFEDEKVPMARYRILAYHGPDRFILVADEQVLSVYPAAIINSLENIEAVRRRVTIGYDSTDNTDPDAVPYVISMKK